MLRRGLRRTPARRCFPPNSMQTNCKCENCKCGERRVAEVKANAEFMAGFGQALREHLSDTRPTPFADIKRV